MSLNPSSTLTAPRLVARTAGLLLNPCAEWALIESESTTVGRLFCGFVAPLAAIGPLALIVNGLFFAQGPLGRSWTWVVVSLLLEALLAYAVSLVITCLLALIIDRLAPGFCGHRNRVQAFKAAAYAGAAGWIAGAFGAVPWLGPLVLVGVGYSIFLLYRGLPRLMRTPPEQAFNYTASTVGAALAFGVLAFVVLGSLGAAISSATGLNEGLFGMPSAAPSRRIALAGGGSVDVAELAAAARQAQLTRASPDAAATATPLTAARLRSLLPDRLDDFIRGEVSADTRSIGGASAPRAWALYSKDDAHIGLRVSDLASAKTLAAVAMAFDVERTKITPQGYRRVGQIDGRPMVERFDSRRSRGEFSVLVANRFLIEATGDGVPISQLEAAAQGLDYARLEALARGG